MWKAKKWTRGDHYIRNCFMQLQRLRNPKIAVNKLETSLRLKMRTRCIAKGVSEFPPGEPR
jgi:hypothetical protein